MIPIHHRKIDFVSLSVILSILLSENNKRIRAHMH